MSSLPISGHRAILVDHCCLLYHSLFAHPSSRPWCCTRIASIRLLGGAIGSTMLNIIIDAKSRQTLPSYISQAVLPLGFPAKELPALIAAMSEGTTAFQGPGATPVILAAASSASRNAWSYAFRTVEYYSIRRECDLCCMLRCRSIKIFHALCRDSP